MARLLAILIVTGGLSGFVLLGGCKTDAECAQDCRCEMQGLCGGAGQKCAATKDEHCRKARVCKLFGKCAAKNGECAPGSTDDCVLSDQCKWTGKCSYVDGECRQK